MPEKKRKYLKVSLGIGLTALCLWLAVPGSGLTSKWEGLNSTASALKGADYWWLVPLMALLAVFFLTKAYRWAFLLDPLKRLRTFEVFPVVMIGFMGNNVLPAHLGEFLRMYVLSKTHMLSNTAVLLSIVLERVLDAVAITILFAITALSMELPEIYKIGGTIGAAVVFLILLSLMLYVHRTDMVLGFWDRRSRFLPGRLRDRIAGMITNGSHGLDTFRNPGHAIYVVIFSVGHWSLMGLYVYLVFRAFSIDLPFSAALLVHCGTMVAVVIPYTPGFWGLIQVVFIVVLTPLGVPQELALAASVYYLASQYVPTTLTGLIFVGRMGFRLREVRSQRETEQIAVPDSAAVADHIS